MANVSLVPHPATPGLAVRSVSVMLERRAAGRVRLRYSIDGTGALRLPPPACGERADGLWRTTCMEMFVRRRGEAAYHEFNFSPSSQWAAYGFSACREGMTDLVTDPPVIALAMGEDHLSLAVDLVLPIISGDETVEVALAAMIEERSGTLSCWALWHPVGRPDFHHRDCFALMLPPPDDAQEGQS